jgi:hypothetical protein
MSGADEQSLGELRATGIPAGQQERVFEEFRSYLLSLFGAREDDVAMIVLHRTQQTRGDLIEEDTCAAGSSFQPGRS